MALYERRIDTHRAMLDIDKIIDRQPTSSNVQELVELDIENKAIFKELDSYNSTQKFIFIHPLTKALEHVDRLRTLRKNNPEQFTNELVNCDKSITRYKSMIKNKKNKDNNELQDWTKLLKDYEQKLKLMNMIISE